VLPPRNLDAHCPETVDFGATIFGFAGFLLGGADVLAPQDTAEGLGQDHVLGAEDVAPGPTRIHLSDARRHHVAGRGYTRLLLSASHFDQHPLIGLVRGSNDTGQTSHDVAVAGVSALAGNVYVVSST